MIDKWEGRMPPNCRRDDIIRKVIFLPHCNFQFNQGISTYAKITGWNVV